MNRRSFLRVTAGATATAAFLPHGQAADVETARDLAQRMDRIIAL